MGKGTFFSLNAVVLVCFDPSVLLLKGFPLLQSLGQEAPCVCTLLKEGIDCGGMANLYLCSGLFSFGIVGVFSMPQKLAIGETKQNARKGRKLFFCVSVEF